ncbi:unnamed protein product [Discula destructiva]
MSVYVITGTSKGIGFEFLKQISEDPKNLFVGLVRDKAATEKKVAELPGDRSNVHIVHADLTNYASLKQAADETAKIVGDRGIDYLIANGAYLDKFDSYDPIGVLGTTQVERLEEVAAAAFKTNVVGNIHLFNLFLPLVLKGKLKKVIAITSGHSDLEFINSNQVDVLPIYAASKAAMNTIVAKFNAQYQKDGVLFMSLCPGVVAVGHFDDATPEQMQRLGATLGKMKAYAPHFNGASTPEDAVQTLRSTMDRASIETGFGGAVVSKYGNKQWL